MLKMRNLPIFIKKKVIFMTARLEKVRTEATTSHKSCNDEETAGGAFHDYGNQALGWL